jgi:hypothetical protein
MGREQVYCDEVRRWTTQNEHPAPAHRLNITLTIDGVCTPPHASTPMPAL